MMEDTKLFQKKGRAQIYHLCIYTNHATRFLLLKKPARRESLGIDTDLETALPAFFSASAARLSAKITAGVVFSLSDVAISVGRLGHRYRSGNGLAGLLFGL